MTECIKRAHSVWSTCRCPDCRQSTFRYRKANRMGKVQRVPTEVAWQVLDELVDAGWSAQAIASAYGVERETIWKAIQRRQEKGSWQRFGPGLSAALAGPRAVPTQGFVPALGSTRRLQALAAIGWSLPAIEEATGLPTDTASAIRGGKYPSVRAPQGIIVARVYDQLSGTPGRSDFTRNYASRRGWVPPLGWDDIDNPAEKPAPSGRKVSKMDRLTELLDLGGSDRHELGRRLGMDVKNVDIYLRRLGGAA